MRHNQNRRSRGRSRKGPNPLSRSYESNGPDVKVRGNAAHVAEKYMSLARDAHAAGDVVAAENYLQHAEHYNRIVMAAQAQFQQSQPQFREGVADGHVPREVEGLVEPRTLLVQLLREILRLTGTHVGCDTSQLAVMIGALERYQPLGKL